MAKKIIVIGSGFGGLAAALRLKAKGYKVTLVEKHPDLGGRARVFKKDQFIYDGGPTVITAPYLFEELFSLFNKKISDYVEIVPLDLWYRFVFSNGDTFDYNGNDKSMEAVTWILFWPAVFVMDGNDAEASRLAQAKGEAEAILAAMISKNCQM